MELNGVKLTWLGHSTFRIETPEGKTLVVDPWVAGNPSCPESAKSFAKIDALLATHGHFDHIADAIPLATQHKATVVGIYELCHWLERKGVSTTSPMNKGGSQSVAGVKVTMVHADHSCGILDGDEIIYGGEAVGYIMEFSNGLRVYHAGDTNVFGDMAIIRELYAPHIAMLPIGDLFTMSPKEAAYAVNLLKPKTVVPMHFGTFPPLVGRPVDLQRLVPQVEVYEMEPGVTVG